MPSKHSEQELDVIFCFSNVKDTRISVEWSVEGTNLEIYPVAIKPVKTKCKNKLTIE